MIGNRKHGVEVLAMLVAATFTVGSIPPRCRADNAPKTSDRLPRVFLLDPAGIAQTRQRVASGDKELAPAMKRLREEADEALTAGPFSVVNKKIIPPSGDEHDYMSVGPYWWPDPKKPDGLPYIRRDGEVNPERHRYDNVSLGRMTDAVDTLALAWYLTDHEPYAQHAARLLRVWFLDPATRMNPNLEFGQAVPGRSTGRGIGIIDTTGLAFLADSLAMLEGSKSWTEADQKGLEAWYAAYLKWLLESKYGRDEAAAGNNHGTWYDVQVARFALFAGREDLARQVLAEVPAKRIATQIEPDGAQPLELARTKAFSYSTMNLRGMFELATLGDRVGVDLWHFQTADGRSLRKALDWLLPFALGEKPWAHQQIARFDAGSYVSLVRLAAVAYREPRYEQLIARLPASRADDRDNLLCPPPR